MAPAAEPWLQPELEEQDETESQPLAELHSRWTAAQAESPGASEESRLAPVDARPLRKRE